MKQAFLTLVLLPLLTVSGFAQSTTTVTSELVFQNPVLTSGTAGQDGAVYTFSNVAAGVDAAVKIKARSSVSVTLTSIDVSNMGFAKAFQPQLGIAGNVPANQDWWMDFEMCFFKAGTSEKKKLNEFKATAIDVDGDGVSIREYLQMNKVKSVAYCPVNYLAPQAPSSTSSNEDDYSSGETNIKVLGPVQNFYNIDTLGTPVMATYTYQDRSSISFRYGAKSGSIISNAGERLNSLWFKAFNLAAPSLLPIKFSSFTAMYNKKKVSLNWTAQSDESLGSFVIERSTNGSSFEAISQQPALIGTSSYSFYDEQLPSAASVIYYRIRSKEKSGEVNFSPIKVIRISQEASITLSIYPNPVQRSANVTLPAAWQNKAVSIAVYNSIGSEVQRNSIKAASQTEALDLGALPGGFYVVKAVCNGQWSEQRIVKN
ncbi:MAG TPA: T9SS type A sorting domain-containing protein [Flavisolibacter sp.]|jgi:hypothetical protein|nr:T9SS type A sorting domain-containing protein [Flavisolibacter sp.]